MAASHQGENDRGRQVLVDLLRFATGNRAEQVADQLIRRLGSAERALTISASPPTFCVDDDPQAIKLIEVCNAAIGHCLHANITKIPIFRSNGAFTCSERLLGYLNHKLRHRAIECVHVLHLDGRNHLIADERVSAGTVDRAEVHVREVMRRAVELGSSAIILAHNHPGGDPRPSRQDITLTRSIVEACRIMNVVFIDHVIVGDQGHYSFREHLII